MTGVRFDRLTKRYDRVAVVDDASLELVPGGVTFLLGPSGAGKTTVGRLIAGLEAPDEGEIYINSRLVQDLPPAARKVGFLFQDDALWPNLTAAENLGFVLKRLHVPRGERRERVAETLNALRIDALARLYPEALSGLQRQKVALARAVVGRPEVLIVDEPLGRLEARVRDEFREEFRRVRAEAGVTTLVLGTDPREALALADRVAVIDLGRLLQVGSPDVVYNRPVDTFTARLLGPTNLIQGQVEGAGGRDEVVVRTPFGRLVGRAPEAATPSGTAVTLAIRPEALTFGPTIPQGSNRIAATVERLVFLGETRQAHLRGPGDWPLTALALQSQSQGLREGQSLTLSVHPEQVVVLVGKYAVAR